MSNTPIFYSAEGAPFKVIGVQLNNAVLYIILRGVGGEYDGEVFTVYLPTAAEVFTYYAALVGTTAALQKVYQALSGDVSAPPIINTYTYLGVLRTLN